jgi:predicted nucleotidyltransferase
LLKRHQVLEGIEASLASTPGVRDAAYFGSTAAGTADALSDVDLVVRCDPDAALVFLRSLHADLGLVLHRPFSEGRNPSGRYWFRGGSPFQRLDVSFFGGCEFDEIMAGGGRYARPPFRPLRLGGPRASITSADSIPAWSPLDHDFAGALRDFHEAAKAESRGRMPKRPIKALEDEVLGFASCDLRPEAWRLYEQTVAVLGGFAEQV